MVSDADTLVALDLEVLRGLVDRFGLPLHVIDLARLAANARSFRQVFERLHPPGVVCFALKANPCRGAARAAASLGLGADVASEHELRAALDEGVAPARIVCNGNAKSPGYLDLCVAQGLLVAVDSPEELAALDGHARRAGRTAPVLLRFSGMPLDGLTAPDQSTANHWTKFGFRFDDAGDAFRRARACRGLTVRGLSAHIGTQICELDGYRRLVDHLLTLLELAAAAGLAPRVLDLGGGYPVSYLSRLEWEGLVRRLRDQLAGRGAPGDAVTWNDLPMGFAHLQGRPPDDASPWRGKTYWSGLPGAAMLEALLAAPGRDGEPFGARLTRLATTLIVEPGRALIGTAGVTLAQVGHTRTVCGHRVVTLDMGVVNHGTNLVAPDLFPLTVLPPAPGEPVEAFLAGRLCFTGDMVSKVKLRLDREPRPGDWLVLHHTGAYCADHFASNSCGFPRPGKVALREDGGVEVWRRPEAFEDVFPAVERLPR